MNTTTSALLISIPIAIFAAYSHAQSSVQTITSECTTDATGGDGARKNCHAKPSILNAPLGYVFSEKSAAGGYTSKNGSENECQLHFSNYVEVIPGSEIMQPKTVSLKAYALSPKGYFSGRGWSKCLYEIKLSKFQQ